MKPNASCGQDAKEFIITTEGFKFRPLDNGDHPKRLPINTTPGKSASLLINITKLSQELYQLMIMTAVR